MLTDSGPTPGLRTMCRTRDNRCRARSTRRAARRGDVSLRERHCQLAKCEWGAMNIAEADPSRPADPNAGTPDGSAPRHNLVSAAIPFVVYAVLAIWFCRTTLFHLGTRLPGGADGVLFAWYFELSKQSVVHLHNPFFTTALNAPHGVNVMWNTGVLALSIPAVPLTAAIGPVATVGIFVVLAPFVSALSACFVLRRLFASRTGAFIGGLLFGFGPFEVGQTSHLHLSFAPLIPLMSLFAWRVVDPSTSRRLRAGIWLGVTIGVEMLIAEELVALWAVLAVSAFCIYAALNWSAVRPHLVGSARALAAAAGSSLLICGLPLAYQLFGRQALLSGTEAGANRTDLWALVHPTALQAYKFGAQSHPGFHLPANGAENTGFLGWPLLLLVLGIGAWYLRSHRRSVIWAMATIAVAIVLSLGSPISYRGHRIWFGPWAIAHHTPLLAGAQAVRYSLFILLLVGGVIAWWLSGLSGRRWVAAVGAVGLCLLPLVPVRFPAAPLPATPRFFTTSAVKAIPEGATVLMLPSPGFPHVQGMLWQLRANLRFHLIGGYGVFNVRGHSSYFPDLSGYGPLIDISTGTKPIHAFDPTTTLNALHRDGVSYIVITEALKNRDAAIMLSVEATGCTPVAIADVTLCKVS